ncbi:hypothetical protein GCM10027063_40880 [Promicromonospora xylanilytica]
MALYESTRALHEIENSRVTQTVRKFGLERIVTGAVESTVEAGFTDNVDRALRVSKRRRRHVLRDPHQAGHQGQLLDVRVSSLGVGVMPFLFFAGRAHLSAFWAHSTVLGRNKAAPRELVLVGSLDNLATRRWQPRHLSEIGHDYPSDPACLSRIVAAELGLDGPAVDQHIHDYEDAYFPKPGERAQFAWGQTTRASHELALPGAPTTWIHDRVHDARIVAITTDVQPDAGIGTASILLARPVLIQDIT